MRRYRSSNVAITTVLILSCLLVFTMLPVLAWQKYPLPTMGGTGTIIINSPSDNETVVYDQATGTWVNAALSAVARDSLSCTATGLTYDHATGITSITPGYGIPTTANQTNWNTAYSHISATGNPHSAALGDLTNVNISFPSNGQVLKYDTGTSKWVNATGGGSYGDGNVLTLLGTWPGSDNLTTVGTIGSGTWHGSAIGDSYISSAATWNAKQNALTAGVDYLTPSGNGSSLTGLTGGQISGNISGNAANVTGTVAIANGGTGATTASAAFNALRPTTAKGDIVSDNGTATAILAAGTNGYVLTRDDSTATGLKWDAAGAVALSSSNVDGITTILNGTTIEVASWIPNNILLLAFYRSVDKSTLPPMNMVDGIIDTFYDTTGIFTATNFTHGSHLYTQTNPVGGQTITQSSSGQTHYDNLNNGSGESGGNGHGTRSGQCFTMGGTSYGISNIKLNLYRDGSPTGTAYFYIYPATGTVGSTAIPNTAGAALSTGSKDVTTISSGSYTLYTINMSSALLSANTGYCLEVRYSGGNASNYVLVGKHIEGGTLAGSNQFYYDGSYHAGATYDLTFEVNALVPATSTLISTSTTAVSQPSEVMISLYEEDITAGIVPGTSFTTSDIAVGVSRDNGTTYTAVPLIDEGYYASGKRILSGSVDISGQPSGTQMKWKVTSANAKTFNLYGAGLTWK
ncbi:MAG: hypothetical protein HQL05_04485 [Nitrospirae bacterium]|nr:hypothetical protein [Nitrospirota bacterium]